MLELLTFVGSDLVVVGNMDQLGRKKSILRGLMMPSLNSEVSSDQRLSHAALKKPYTSD
jgi:hypothetical protein